VLLIELRNRPGTLAKAAERLARAGIKVRYLYATADRPTQKTAAVVAAAVGDLDRANGLFLGQ
jgi:hypothetical protein